ncbi:MAG: Pyridoxal phosphate homeostasis protein [Elusimicrobia bacterium]|nr:Pyridoxal phosphate homeostasis protein [Elusimicrobiota bacterium]
MPVERIREAVRLGIKDFGENRVQEALLKRPELEKDFLGTTQYLIGQLQTNKVRKALELFDVIESVDRIKLVEALDRVASETGKKQRCLIEIKISSEDTKSGVPLAEAEEFVEKVRSYKNLKLEGLMTIGALKATTEETRQSFRRLNQFFKTHSSRFGEKPILSMGMSDDYEIAIEEGATQIRLGRALFGERS